MPADPAPVAAAVVVRAACVLLVRRRVLEGALVSLAALLAEG